MKNLNIEKLDWAYNSILDEKNELKLNKNIKLGLEIEVELKRDNYKYIKEQIDTLSSYHDIYNTKWKFKFDGANYELISPVISDEKEHWKTLENSLEVLKQNNAIVDEDYNSLQVSFDMSIFRNNKISLERFLKLWKIYEPEIYRFGYGTREQPRDLIKQRANPIGNIIEYIFIEGRTINGFLPYLKLLQLQYLESTKSWGININDKPQKNGSKNRIEIRNSNGTMSLPIIKNTTQFYTHLIEATHDEYKDWEYVDYLLKENTSIEKVGFETLKYEKTSLLNYLYQEYQAGVVNHPPRYDKALELGEFLYSKDEQNLEKSYLKQYLKNNNNYK